MKTSTTSNSSTLISCLSCIHFVVCEFKPNPDMGSHSGGWIPNCSYEEYRDLLWELKAEHCSDFIVRKE